MDLQLRTALENKLLALADDELILAHRDSEWTGHAPILEEDIAFANIAQDEMGHARSWLEVRQALTGETPDELAFFREADDFRNVPLVALPRGDWAFSMLRQYLFDSYELVSLAELVNSEYRPVAEVAQKLRPEELYHYRHSSSWVKRLGLGTVESLGRMQAALTTLWPYALQLFEPLPDEALLVAARFGPSPAGLKIAWLELVVPFLQYAGLQLPTVVTPPAGSRPAHTPHLTELLAEMQQVARLDPSAIW